MWRAYCRRTPPCPGGTDADLRSTASPGPVRAGPGLAGDSTGQSADLRQTDAAVSGLSVLDKVTDTCDPTVPADLTEMRIFIGL